MKKIHAKIILKDKSVHYRTIPYDSMVSSIIMEIEGVVKVLSIGHFFLEKREIMVEYLEEPPHKQGRPKKQKPPSFCAE